MPDCVEEMLVVESRFKVSLASYHCGVINERMWI